MKSIRLNAVLFRAALTAAVVFASGAAFAQQPSQPTQAAIDMSKEILEIKGAGTIFDPIIPGVIEQSKNMYLQQNPALQKDLNEIAAALRTEYASRRDEVMKTTAQTWAKHFTEAELKDILAFYKSPVGRKVIAEEPRALQESMNFAQEWAVKFSDEITERLRAELKKRGHEM